MLCCALPKIDCIKWLIETEEKKTSITSHYYGFVRVHYSNVEWWKMPLWINSIDVAHDIYEKKKKKVMCTCEKEYESVGNCMAESAT